MVSALSPENTAVNSSLAPADTATAAATGATSATGATASSTAGAAPPTTSNLMISTGQASAASSIYSANSSPKFAFRRAPPVLRSNCPSTRTAATI